MKLVCDQQIPFISDFFKSCCDITLLPAETMKQDNIRTADILLVRTITTVDSSLLENTRIQFVGSATTGVDHIDRNYLSRRHIAFTDAAGANSNAVVNYVMSCLAALRKTNQLEKRSTIGVIGCGRIGSAVLTLLSQLGLKAIGYDPFIEKYAGNLEMLLRHADLITLHTPLTFSGSHPTHHLINKNLLSYMKKNAVIINAARGGVIAESDLLNDPSKILCLDVWENEPSISLELCRRAFIATPHIAGYSLPAKYQATQLLYQKAAEFFHWPSVVFSKAPNLIIKKSADLSDFLMLYDPVAHTAAFREALLNGECAIVFKQQRNDYPLRNEIRVIT